MGLFDTIGSELASLLTDVFVETPSKFTRQRDNYDGLSARDVAITDASALIKITPPTPFQIRLVDGKNVLSQDCYTYVSAKDLEDANFDVVPVTGVQVLVENGGRIYRVMRVEPVSGGDAPVVYGLHLR